MSVSNYAKEFRFLKNCYNEGMLTSVEYFKQINRLQSAYLAGKRSFIIPIVV